MFTQLHWKGSIGAFANESIWKKMLLFIFIIRSLINQNRRCGTRALVRHDKCASIVFFPKRLIWKKETGTHRSLEHVQLACSQEFRKRMSTPFTIHGIAHGCQCRNRSVLTGSFEETNQSAMSTHAMSKIRSRDLLEPPSIRSLPHNPNTININIEGTEHQFVKFIIHIRKHLIIVRPRAFGGIDVISCAFSKLASIPVTFDLTISYLDMQSRT